MDRHLAGLFADRLSRFPCIALLGPRQAGKRAFLAQALPGWKSVDLEMLADYYAVARNPELFLQLEVRETVFHEPALLPTLLPALRAAIDREPERMGRFVITGSVSAGMAEILGERVALLEMGPLDLAEACGLPPAPLYRLIGEKASAEELLALSPRTRLDQIGNYWLRGGYPAVWRENTPDFDRSRLQDILQIFLDRDLPRLGTGLNRAKYQLFLQMLAHLSGNIVNYSEVARALGVTQPTARNYFRIACEAFLWRELPAFENNTAKRFVKHPKGHLRDSGLLHCLLHLQRHEELMAHPRLEQSWQGMVIENLLGGLAAANVVCQASHYRTGAGAAVDLVLEGHFGLLPVSVRYHGVPRLRGLHDFVAENGCRYALVINNDAAPRLLDEKLIGLPATVL